MAAARNRVRAVASHERMAIKNDQRNDCTWWYNTALPPLLLSVPLSDPHKHKPEPTFTARHGDYNYYFSRMYMIQVIGPRVKD